MFGRWTAVFGFLDNIKQKNNTKGAADRERGDIKSHNPPVFGCYPILWKSFGARLLLLNTVAS